MFFVLFAELFFPFGNTSIAEMFRFVKRALVI